MTMKSRRETIQKLMNSEGVAGRLIADDADFMSLAERWINREIEMPEMRRLYQAVLEERRARKRSPPHPPETATLGAEPPS